MSSSPNYRYSKVPGKEATKSTVYFCPRLLAAVALLFTVYQLFFRGSLTAIRVPLGPYPSQFKPVYVRCLPKQKENKNVTHEPHYPNQTFYRIIVAQEPGSWVIRAPTVNNQTEVVILVSTRNNHEKERVEIRRSWGNRLNGFVLNNTVRIIFLLGENAEEQGCLLKEQEKFDDLLIVKANDSYRYVVYKLLMGYRYIATKFPNAHVIKVFKDTVVDIDQLIAFIPKLNSTPLIYGYIFWGSGPVRDEKSQWFVPQSAYNSSDYPEYAKENFYIMNRPAFKELMKPETLTKVKVVEVNDVFFTGILRRQAGFNVSFLQEFALNHPDPDKCPKKSERGLIATKLITNSIENSYNQFMNFKERGCDATE